MSRMLLCSLAVVACLTSLTSIAAAQDAEPRRGLPASLTVTRDIEYGTAGEGGRALRLDILRRKERGPEPVAGLVHIHGGGWRAGSKERFPPHAVALAERGYVVASVEYRLSQEAIFPAQIEDVKAAVRWLRANAADLGVDPERIGAFGGSAGGHLSALLGTSGDVAELEGEGGSADLSSRVQAVAPLAAPGNLVVLGSASRGASAPLAQLLGGPVREKKDLARLASPVTHASADDPPFLIVHGAKDPLVPVEQSALLLAALTKAGVRAERLVLPDAGHGLRGPEVDAALIAFFDRALAPRGR